MYGDAVRVVIRADVAATVRGLLVVGTASERLVLRACVAEDGIMLVGDEEELRELVGYVAAEATTSKTGRARSASMRHSEVLNDALDQARPL